MHRISGERRTFAGIGIYMAASIEDFEAAREFPIELHQLRLALPVTLFEQP